MDERPPETPDAPQPTGTPGAPERAATTPALTPDPHRGEPTPPAEVGLRPEADPAMTRPEQQERTGPLSGLIHAASTEVQAGIGGSAAAHAEDERMGVEGEGIESSQIFGLMLATVLAVASIVLFLYFMFYLPKRDATAAQSENVPADRYVEVRELRAQAEDRLAHYATGTGADSGRYVIPIEQAMRLVQGQYGAQGRRPMLPFGPASVQLGPVPATGRAATAGMGMAADSAVVPASAAASTSGPAGAAQVETTQPPTSQPPPAEH
ncbi:MAG TPA: hypothetical protein VD962_10280 [Rubricoccaceae bacterium]|nr:hypothetical protein [Rubricoccaceae bacterium]